MTHMLMLGVYSLIGWLLTDILVSTFAALPVELALVIGFTALPLLSPVIAPVVAWLMDLLLCLFHIVYAVVYDIVIMSKSIFWDPDMKTEWSKKVYYAWYTMNFDPKKTYEAKHPEITKKEANV